MALEWTLIFETILQCNLHRLPFVDSVKLIDRSNIVGDERFVGLEVSIAWFNMLLVDYNIKKRLSEILSIDEHRMFLTLSIHE